MPVTNNKKHFNKYKAFNENVALFGEEEIGSNTVTKESSDVKFEDEVRDDDFNRLRLGRKKNNKSKFLVQENIDSSTHVVPTKKIPPMSGKHVTNFSRNGRPMEGYAVKELFDQINDYYSSESNIKKRKVNFWINGKFISYVQFALWYMVRYTSARHVKSSGYSRLKHRSMLQTRPFYKEYYKLMVDDRVSRDTGNIETYSYYVACNDLCVNPRKIMSDFSKYFSLCVGNIGLVSVRYSYARKVRDILVIKPHNLEKRGFLGTRFGQGCNNLYVNGCIIPLTISHGSDYRTKFKYDQRLYALEWTRNKNGSFTGFGGPIVSRTLDLDDYLKEDRDFHLPNHPLRNTIKIAKNIHSSEIRLVGIRMPEYFETNLCKDITVEEVCPIVSELESLEIEDVYDFASEFATLSMNDDYEVVQTGKEYSSDIAGDGPGEDPIFDFYTRDLLLSSKLIPDLIWTGVEFKIVCVVYSLSNLEQLLGQLIVITVPTYDEAIEYVNSYFRDLVELVRSDPFLSRDGLVMHEVCNQIRQFYSHNFVAFSQLNGNNGSYSNTDDHQFVKYCRIKGCNKRHAHPCSRFSKKNKASAFYVKRKINKVGRQPKVTCADDEVPLVDLLECRSLEYGFICCEEYHFHIPDTESGKSFRSGYDFMEAYKESLLGEESADADYCMPCDIFLEGDPNDNLDEPLNKFGNSILPSVKVVDKKIVEKKENSMWFKQMNDLKKKMNMTKDEQKACSVSFTELRSRGETFDIKITKQKLIKMRADKKITKDTFQNSLASTYTTNSQGLVDINNLCLLKDENIFTPSSEPSFNNESSPLLNNNPIVIGDKTIKLDEIDITSKDEPSKIIVSDDVSLISDDVAESDYLIALELGQEMLNEKNNSDSLLFIQNLNDDYDNDDDIKNIDKCCRKSDISKDDGDALILLPPECCIPITPPPSPPPYKPPCCDDDTTTTIKLFYNMNFQLRKTFCEKYFPILLKIHDFMFTYSKEVVHHQEFSGCGTPSRQIIDVIQDTSVTRNFMSRLFSFNWMLWKEKYTTKRFDVFEKNKNMYSSYGYGNCYMNLLADLSIKYQGSINVAGPDGTYWGHCFDKIKAYISESVDKNYFSIKNFSSTFDTICHFVWLSFITYNTKICNQPILCIGAQSNKSLSS